MKKMSKPSVLSLSIFAVFSTLAHAEDVVSNPDKVIKLDTIVVTASGSEQNVADAPASISVIR